MDGSECWSWRRWWWRGSSRWTLSIPFSLSTRPPSPSSWLKFCREPNSPERNLICLLSVYFVYFVYADATQPLLFSDLCWLSRAGWEGQTFTLYSSIFCLKYFLIFSHLELIFWYFHIWNWFSDIFTFGTDFLIFSQTDFLIFSHLELIFDIFTFGTDFLIFSHLELIFWYFYIWNWFSNIFFFGTIFQYFHIDFCFHGCREIQSINPNS